MTALPSTRWRRPPPASKSIEKLAAAAMRSSEARQLLLDAAASPAPPPRARASAASRVFEVAPPAPAERELDEADATRRRVDRLERENAALAARLAALDVERREGARLEAAAATLATARGVPAADAAPRTTPAPPRWSAAMEVRVRAMYAAYAPEKLANVPMLLVEHGDALEPLMDALVRKYGPEPAADDACDDEDTYEDPPG